MPGFSKEADRTLWSVGIVSCYEVECTFRLAVGKLQVRQRRQLGIPQPALRRSLGGHSSYRKQRLSHFRSLHRGLR